MAQAAGGNLEQLLAGVAARDPRMLARAISIVEDRREGCLELLKALYPRTGKARILGITGPPGAGKSTLVDLLAGRIRAAGKTVGILAVDPSSAYSGGAILGDRIRMQRHTGDSGVYMRSMATRGHLGGLSKAAGDAVDVLDAAGFDVILVETVGVGQDEVDIVKMADTSLVVLVPGLGDDVQALKAGIMEIADVFVVNKSDREGADRVVAEIQQMLSLATTAPPFPPPIVKVSALRNEGLDELDAASAAHAVFLETGGGREKRRRARAEMRFREALTDMAVAHALAVAGPAAVTHGISDVAARRVDPYSFAAQVLRAAGLAAGDAPRLEQDPARAAPRVDHIGVAVRSIAQRRGVWEQLGLAWSGEETVPEQKVRVGFLQAGNTRIELLEPTADDSPVAKFLDKRGEGVHHVCFGVTGIEARMRHLREAGFRLTSETPQAGAHNCRVTFLHPQSTGGVLTELSEPGAEPRNEAAKGKEHGS